MADKPGDGEETAARQTSEAAHEHPERHQGPMRRAMSGAIDATLGRVGHTVAETALDVTGITAQQIIEDLEPYLIAEAVPRIIEGITPYLAETTVPDVLEALQDHLINVTVPQIVDGLVPHLNEQVVPLIVDALMPKIRDEIVPAVLADIVDDPAVRDLIREQSAGLVLDAVERIREGISQADTLVEAVGRKVLRRPVRIPADTALIGEPPPGREFLYAGLVTRGAAFALDTALVSWLLAQGLSALINVLDSLFGELPAKAVAVLTGTASLCLPIYFAMCWWLTGRTLAGALLGTTVRTRSGKRLGFGRALVRALLSVGGIAIWLISAATSFLDGRRRTWLDQLVGTEVRYQVPANQQRRYLREKTSAPSHQNPE